MSKREVGHVVVCAALLLGLSGWATTAAGKTGAKKSTTHRRAAPAVRAGDSPGEKFQVFCGEWMKKLAARERNNLKQIRWVPNGSGVDGEYVGYSSEHTCQLASTADPKAVPVGKISYREMRYQKHAPSPAEVDGAPPRVLEITEVTEIFRYAKGKWEY